MIQNGLNNTRSSQGFSLMEVLVAMLVLAIGLLGLASLQTQSLKFNHDAYVRSQATILASEIMDKMRANPSNGAAFAAAEPDPDDCDLTLNPGAINDTTPELEVCFWLTDIQNRLPSGSGDISVNAATATMYDVTIDWSDRTTDNQDECEAGGRVWDGGNTLCLITQVWTVFPN